MNITGDFHTHGQFSHGKGDVYLNAAAAYELGLKCIACTEHGLYHIMGGLKASEINEAKACTEQAKKAFPSLTMYFGIEANIISPEGLIDILPRYSSVFEVVIAGFHYFATAKRFYDTRRLLWRNALRSMSFDIEKLKQRNTATIIRTMERYKIDALSHLGTSMPVNVREVARVAAQTHTCIEINNKHCSLSAAELKICEEEGADFLINSDAHCPENVGHVERAERMVLEAGLDTSRILNYGNNIYIPKRFR